MNRLIAELKRLYFLDHQPGYCLGGGADTRREAQIDAETLARCLAGEAGVALELVGPEGDGRAMVVAFGKGSGWEAVARLYEGVQEDFDLPAPAISVSGGDGYQVWFSLAEPVAATEARAFLAGLRRRYLAELPAGQLSFHPDGGETLALVPALQPETGKWSAFIDPSMGAMFGDEPWLEMAPNMDKQADLLAGFASIKPGEFRRTLDMLGAEPAPDKTPAPGDSCGKAHARLGVGCDFTDPQSFLLAVMNDASASPRLRIEAAKALLPYFSGSRA